MRNLRPALATVTALLLITACGSSTGTGSSAEPPVASHSGHSATSAGPSQPLRSGEKFVDLRMPQAYTPAAPNGGTDEYRCFLVDPELTEPAYLTGSRFLPQNAAVVHHAIFYRLSPEQATSAVNVDAQTPGQGWTCFGGAGVDGQTAWVAHWAPGTGETLMPAGYGFAMSPGSKLVMQVHYNLLGAPAGTAISDQSGIQLRLADGSTELGGLETALVTAPIELPCEKGDTATLCDRAAAVADVAKRFGQDAGEQVQQLAQMCGGGAVPKPGNTQYCDHKVDESGTILMAGGHMHLLGRSIKVQLNPGTAAEQTIVDVPHYNFDNQALVPLAKPVTFKPGDTLRITCTHDAALRKQLPQLQGLPSRYVVWGDGTSDEMCLGVMVVAATQR